jgi:hypothetical protein
MNDIFSVARCQIPVKRGSRTEPKGITALTRRKDICIDLCCDGKFGHNSMPDPHNKASIDRSVSPALRILLREAF